MGRPSHKPTPELRRQVESMAGFGIPEDDIALSIDISARTLRKYYRRELDTGHIKANSAVAQSLYKKALADGPAAVTACIFWMKTRAGWKETVVNEHGGVGGGPIKVEKVSARDVLADKLAGLAARVGPPSDIGEPD
jgi:hypothetical protein